MDALGQDNTAGIPVSTILANIGTEDYERVTGFVDDSMTFAPFCSLWVPRRLASRSYHRDSTAEKYVTPFDRNKF
jgi:hypothetical protein